MPLIYKGLQIKWKKTLNKSENIFLIPKKVLSLIMERYEVHIDNNLFKVYDTKTDKYVTKGYKYSRYAHNIQANLESKEMYN